ncbi:MAG: hypothetical protein ACYSYV_04035, partial [Planctomycetota bacterium]
IFSPLSSVFRSGSLRSPTLQTDDLFPFDQTYTQIITPGSHRMPIGFQPRASSPTSFSGANQNELSLSTNHGDRSFL